MASTSIISTLGLMLLILTSHVFINEALEPQMSRDGKSSTYNSKVFIVYMGGVSEKTTIAHQDVHMSMLLDVLGSAEAAQSSIVYSYSSSFNGFAAVFSDSHADLLNGRDEVVSVFPSTTYNVHTFDTWEYLGLDSVGPGGLWVDAGFGNDTIVGMLDTGYNVIKLLCGDVTNGKHAGVWPESLSFSDDGFGPIPSTWKGACVKSDNFGQENCNKKLIGGKFFSKGYEVEHGPIEAPEYRSVRDTEGHGTHTASTAAGRRVPNASFLGVGNGTISGGAPSARLAAYKVCWAQGCSDADVLAAFDEAVKDGVDIISISLGATASDYNNGIAIGSFHAVEKGILVSSSAGNSGPSLGSVQNVAPWIFTVAASTINRQWISTLKLGNGHNISGTAINTFTLNQTSYRLEYGGDIAISNNSSQDASYCRDGSIDKIKAQGKILLCYDDNIENSTDKSVLASGAAGTIIIERDEIVQFPAVVPATHVTGIQARDILKYIDSSKSPTAFLAKSDAHYGADAPLTPFFSSVGPNPLTYSILKPDIAAPGVDIIASWSPISNPIGPPNTLLSNFNIVSGTSMACPHVTGAAALLKSLHPDWSPAAIKSALMTTAKPFNAAINQYNNSRELSTGSGQIIPSSAADPGLVYDLKTIDYVNFLCSIGYTAKQVQAISGNKTDACPKVAPKTIDLNYPSIMLVERDVFNATTKRTLTNVTPPPTDGSATSVTYHVKVEQPKHINITVTPTFLTFAGLHAEESFSVSITVNATAYSGSDYSFGSITWNDCKGHVVRIPVGFGQYGINQGGS